VRFRDRWLRQRYRALAASQQDRLYSGGRFEDFAMRAFLDAALAAPSIRAAFAAGDGRPRALEYGTGTGPGACYLAEHGFRVDAIDISPDAIDLARRIAGHRDVSIAFAVEDIVSMARPPRSYDLVLDNHCLHHITSDADRARALGNVRRLLEDDGVYVLETVVYHEGRDYGRDRFDARSSTKLVRVDDPDPGFAGQAFEDLVQIDGTWYWPRSRHRSAAELRVELESAGLRIAYQSSFGGLLLCVADAGAISIEALRREIQERYRDDPVTESVRLQYPLAAAQRVTS
jgi:SAM-dependent methyltransferase